VLKIDVGAERLSVLALDDRDDAQVGDLVLAIGDPFGVGQTVTNGIISAMARSGVGITDVSYFIQTDAAINPGNSGGALVDMNGDMIGMNTAILSQSGTSSGVGFAIPAALIRRVVETAVAGGRVSEVRPGLGVKTQEVSAEIARSIGLDRPQGVLITDVYPDGPGARGGLKQGDLILAIDGAPVNDESTLNYRVVTHRAGDEVVLTLRRNKGASQSVRVRIAPPPGAAGEGRLIAGRNPLGGATVSTLSPAVAEEMGLDPFAAQDGVLVTKVGEGYAANIGVRQGDIIRSLDGATPHTVGELEAAIAANKGGGWNLVIQRGQQTITARLRL
jgi:S1-C subfamily serine protease